MIRRYATPAAALLLLIHVGSMFLGGFSKVIGGPGADSWWPWLSTTVGLFAVPLCTFALVRFIDTTIDHRWPRRYGVGGSIRMTTAFCLVFGVLQTTSALAEQPLPIIGRWLELSTVLISIAVLSGLIFFGLGAADLIYQITSHARSLSTRLTMLLVFAALSTFMWLSFLGLQLRSSILWAIEKGHLQAYVAGVEKLEQAASAWVGGLAGAFSLELPFIVLLAWRFGRNATRSLDALRAGFRRVSQGQYDQPVKVEGHDEVAQMQQGFNHMLTSVREQRFLETAFGRYVSPLILERLRATPERTHLQGERTVATVLFSDIRGFTRLSADLPPERVIALLNAYMSSMIEVIARYDGYINKFVGDAIMVVFGVPLAQPDHTRRAVECALAMQAALDASNEQGGYDGIVVSMGIGLNVGPLVAGNLGNERQVEFTVIGDTVNVASRCCSAAAATQVVVTRSVLDGLGEARSSYEVQSQGPVELKGKGQVELFRIDHRNAEHDIFTS